jgi:hypothetical protein
MPASPTQRTIKKWKDKGYIVAVVERWNPYAKIRQDLFGFVDVLAVGHGRTVAIQTTSYNNVSTRKKKILMSAYAQPLSNAGWDIVVEGWHKKKNRWECREVAVKIPPPEDGGVSSGESSRDTKK